jgi:hypothetical protein
MTLLSSTNDSSSIFKDGKLEPGFYKIQNIYAETYLDIELHSKNMCCRPAKDLEGGRGLVCRHLSSVVHISDNWKWEIKPLGAGYSVQRVSYRSLSILSLPSHVNNVECRLIRENLNSFVTR